MGSPLAGPRLGLLLACAVAVAGCSRSGDATTVAAPAPTAAAPGFGAPDNLPPLPDPASDTRPDRVKLEEAAARLLALQDRLSAADARLIAQVRAALQSSRDADAHAAISQYLAALGADAAAAPTPKPAGCYAAALAPLQQGLDALARQRAVRAAKAKALLNLSYRPLSLADLAPLAPPPEPDADAQAVSAAATRVRSQASACAAVSERPRPARTAQALAAPSAAYQPASPVPSASAPGPAPTPPPPAASPGGASPAAPSKPHKNLLERIFGGGHKGP